MKVIAALDSLRCRAAGFAVACLALFSGCVSGPRFGPLPDWVEKREHSRYPASIYLLGIGTAKSPDQDAAYQEARDRAVADIASQLETQVESEVRTEVDESLHVRDGAERAELISRVSSSVKAVAGATLTAIEPVEQHYDPARALAASLVVIKRADFARQALGRIQDIDGKISTLVDEADTFAGERRLFQAMRRLGTVEDLAIERAALRAQTRFVAPGSNTGEPAVTLADSHARRRALASEVKLVLLCRHDQLGCTGSTVVLESLLVEEFSELGIAVQPGRGDAATTAIERDWNDLAALKAAFDGQLLLLCDVVTTSRAAGHGDMVSVRSRGSARLLDTANGELLITADFSPDTAGVSPAIGARSRLDSLIDRSLAQLATHLTTRILDGI